MEWKPIPSKKSKGVENFLSLMLGKSRTDSIANKKCVFCSEEQDLDSFESDLDLREFLISGICPPCFNSQDKDE